MTDVETHWRAIIRSLRVEAVLPRRPPITDRCPLIDRGCGALCKYDFKQGDRHIDGRCTTKAEAIQNRS